MSKGLSLALWSALGLAGAGALGAIALHRGEKINGVRFVIAAAGCYLAAYRFYSAFIAAKLLALDDTRATPAERLDDGATTSPPTSGSCSAITSLRSRAPARWWARRWPPSSASCRGRCG